jgi:cytochrome c-type biogenesis protein CcmH
MHRTPTLLLVFFSSIMLTLLIGACSNRGITSLEQRAQSIDKSLMCPVCPSETIDQAQVELASQMRVVVREKLAEGWTREQILQFFVDRYDESILAAPPKKGFNLIVWIAPLAVVAGAAVLLYFVLRAMRLGKSGQSGQDEHILLQDVGLEPYLSEVDQELEARNSLPNPSTRSSDNG